MKDIHRSGHIQRLDAVVDSKRDGTTGHHVSPGSGAGALAAGACLRADVRATGVAGLQLPGDEARSPEQENGVADLKELIFLWSNGQTFEKYHINFVACDFDEAVLDLISDVLSLIKCV
ncbi:hypothetical protein [Bordetella petrii]|uniref:hypothetical protein n=1 Tax=Bordetella petrii TaxID=94624 RepID=UPI00138A01DF|nr:hypothetical protein [Bordetella petrii]